MSDSVLLTDDRLADLARIAVASHWVAADGATVHVLDYGGDGPPCVVVPGITTPAVGWDFVVGDLRDLVRPIVLDVRGRGFSSRAASYTTVDYAGDVEALWRALGLSAGVLLGHSMGARIAAVVAARGRVTLLGTILVDPPLSGPGRGPYPTTLASFRQQLAEARAGTTAAAVGAVYPSWPPAELDLRARWLATCDGRAVDETHAAFESEDFFEVWPQVPAPTVFVHGVDSPVVTADGAELAAAMNPAATIVGVAAAGHMVPWDNRAGLIDAVRSALKTITGAAHGG